MALYRELAPEVERLYWGYSFEDLADRFDCGISTIQRAANHADLPKKTEWNRVEHTHGVPIERVLYHLHHDAKMSVNQMSKALGVSRITLDRWFSDTGVYKRGQSEAEIVKNQQKTPDERRQQTAAARKASEEKYGSGGALGAWVRENPEAHREIAKKYAHLGTPARKRNGMEGVTGQDHPRWRGGKSIYDAVKKQLPGKSWRSHKVEAKQRDGYYCKNCGKIGVKLDSHHIVPIMVGGTNGFWNLITLCETCHGKVEAFIRQYPEFNPVLVE